MDEPHPVEPSGQLPTVVFPAPATPMRITTIVARYNQ